MTVLPIVEIGHPILRRPTTVLTRDELGSPQVQQLIDDMIETMRDAEGAGIAANQVGSNYRITTIEVTDNRRYPYKPPIPLTVAVNPVIAFLDNETVVINEGCLSVPLRGDLHRQVNISVTFWDRNGETQTEIKRGLTAGTFQHEIDHLDGRLIVDRIDPATLATWRQYELFHKEDFERRITGFVERVGS